MLFVNLAIQSDDTTRVSSSAPHPVNRRYGSKPDREGWVEWEVMPKLQVKTYFRVHGKLGKDGKGENGLDPIVLLHGGPGVCHEYLLGLLELRQTGRTLIFYDQVGCGRSSLLDDDPRYITLFQRQTWVDELKALVDALSLQKICLYGHSWGGCLAQLFAIEHPIHVSSLILASAVGDSQDWITGTKSRVGELPGHLQKAIYDAEETGYYENQDFERAAQAFVDEFELKIEGAPEGALYSFEQLAKDNRVYGYTWGPSEFQFIGTMSRLTVEGVERITCPVLNIYGSRDEAPMSYAKTYMKLKNSKDRRLEVIEGARHVSWSTHCREYCDAVGAFVGDQE